MSDRGLSTDSGSSFLVTVRSLHAEVREAGLDLLPVDEADSVIAVTYDQSADSFLRTWRSRVGTVPEYVRIVDVHQTMRSAASAPARGSGVRNVVRTVQRPDDLTAVRDAITSALAEATDETVLVFDSLTAPFEHASLAEMVAFLDGVSARLADADATGYFYLETRAHDPPTVATLRVLADGTLELINDGVEWCTRSLANRTGDCPSLDVLFDSLRVRLRRDALRYLLRSAEPVDVDELASVVARLGSDDGEATRNRHRRYYTALYQLHLPKLVDAGLVRHDETKRQVSACEAARWVEPFLALSEE
ncbi:DUF7504 family protein [Haladaptatus salinisoli]|uniref:DUF7504 family protein n=1 Tax=Haladaptatus salinisoli TaxID=2884876 RepID=UPI001D0B2AAE|nr:hypothetical protein [Haladaptatus salinisoli]